MNTELKKIIDIYEWAKIEIKSSEYVINNPDSFTKLDIDSATTRIGSAKSILKILGLL